jgi:hypothetical protein
MDDKTLELPVVPDPDTVATQEIRVVPEHLVGDPILTMDAPRLRFFSLFDYYYGDRPVFVPPPPRQVHHRVPKTHDRVLIGLAATLAALTVLTYVEVASGWHSGASRMQPPVVASSPLAVPSVLPGTSVPVPSPEPARTAQVLADVQTSPSRIPAAVRPRRTVVVPVTPSVPPPVTVSPMPSPSPSPSPTAPSLSPSPPLIVVPVGSPSAPVDPGSSTSSTPTITRSSP